MSDYPIGYRKPPEQTRFKPGQSGNPKGRPKGAKGVSAALQKIFDKTVTVKEGGIPKKIPVTEAIGLRLVEKALQGDPRAIREFITLQQRYEEKHPPEAEVPGPLTVTFRWADAFNPDGEDLDYFTDHEILALRHIMAKREAHIRGEPFKDKYPELRFLTDAEIETRLLEAARKFKESLE